MAEGRDLIVRRTRRYDLVLPARFFADQSSKRRAVLAEVERVHGTGQPMLVGTSTIENSLLLADEMSARGIPFQLLNGIQDAQEAEERGSWRADHLNTAPFHVIGGKTLRWQREHSLLKEPPNP